MPVSQFEPEHIDWDAEISDSCKNNVAFLTYQEIDHKDVMRFLYENVYMTKNREKNCSTFWEGMIMWMPLSMNCRN